MNYFISQIGDKDCGFTCLKMLFAMLYENTAYLYYPEADPNKSMNMNELMAIAKKEGVTLSASRVVDKEELYKEELDKPMLAIVKDSGVLHMVLIKKINKHGVFVLDPKRGKMFLTKNYFNQIWDGEILEVTKAKEVRTNYDDFFVKVIPRHTIILTLLFQFLSLVSLLLTMFFMDKSLNYIIPITLFGLYLVFELIYQKTIMLSLKKFDNAILVNDYTSNKEKFKEYYEPMSKFKVILISEPIKLLSAIIIIIFGIFILGINNIYNLIIVGILFIIQAIFKIFDKKYFLNERNDLEFLENKLFLNLDNNDKEFKRNVTKLNEKSYKLVSYMNLKKYILFFVTLALCLIYQALTGFISIDFMLFHLFLYIYLEENFDKILASSEFRTKYRYYKCLYMHYFH